MATKTRSKAKTTAKKASTKRKTTTKKASAKRKTATKKTTTKRKAAKKAKSTTATGPTCSITKAEFDDGAKRLHLKIMSEGECVAELDLDPREFSSGSFGWFASEKLQVPVEDQRVRCQMSLNVTVIGSKNSK